MSGWTFDERFKAWADSEALTLVTPNNTLEVVTSKDMEAAFLGGINSRNAEVQALREALTYALHVLEHLKVDNPNPLLPNARWKSIDMARAALAGGEQ